MKIINKILSIFFLNLVLLSLPNRRLAASNIEIEGDTPFTDKIIKSGPIKVSVTYTPNGLNSSVSSDDNNLSYSIYYNEQKQVKSEDYTQYTGEVFLQDLDKNGIDEVVIRTFSGGAHCCTNHVIYTWDDQQFIKTETGYLDGNGGGFEDINRDGKLEFLTYDNSFLYKFSSYAGSFPPSLIYSFENGQLNDVTRNHPKILRETLQRMYEVIKERQKDDYQINGVLAGYVAQKILLGEYEEGWKLMLAHYDKNSDWGLEMYDEQGNMTNKYPDFPTALKAFLVQQKYLDDKKEIDSNTSQKFREGNYWIGPVGMGLSIKDGQYQYYYEEGESAWQPVSQLNYVKDGVVFDGEHYWCLSSLSQPSNDRIAVCQASGWVLQ